MTDRAITSVFDFNSRFPPQKTAEALLTVMHSEEWFRKHFPKELNLRHANSTNGFALIRAGEEVIWAYDRHSAADDGLRSDCLAFAPCLCTLLEAAQQELLALDRRSKEKRAAEEKARADARRKTLAAALDKITGV